MSVNVTISHKNNEKHDKKCRHAKTDIHFKGYTGVPNGLLNVSNHQLQLSVLKIQPNDASWWNSFLRLCKRSMLWLCVMQCLEMFLFFFLFFFFHKNKTFLAYILLVVRVIASLSLAALKSIINNNHLDSHYITPNIWLWGNKDLIWLKVRIYLLSLVFCTYCKMWIYADASQWITNFT